MAKFPEPPPADRLRAIGPAIQRVTAGTLLWRVYFRGGPFPGVWAGWRGYGPLATARFDHHEPPPRDQARRILYAALDVATCVAEVFQQKRMVDLDDRSPWLVGFALAADLELLDLTGQWPTLAGASMALSSGSRPRARRWSRAIYDAFPDVAGLWYPSSMHANRPAVALYERAEAALPASPVFHRPLNDPALRRPLGVIARSLGYAVG